MKCSVLVQIFMIEIIGSNNAFIWVILLDTVRIVVDNEWGMGGWWYRYSIQNNNLKSRKFFMHIAFFSVDEM